MIIPLKTIKDTEKVESHKNLKFLMRVKEEEEKTKTISKKEYKFKCETEEEKVAWIFAITNSMKKIKNSDVAKNEQKLNIKVRKKLIHDLFKFPDINLNLAYLREKVLKSMENENYFQPSQKKIEEDKKKAILAEEERKRKEKEEMERKKREEKEEKERKKREDGINLECLHLYIEVMDNSHLENHGIFPLKILILIK